MALTRDQVLATKGRLKTEEVHVPEWVTDGDDVVIVKELVGEIRDRFEASLTTTREIPGVHGKSKGRETVEDLANLTARFVSYCCVDEEGNRLFSEADAVELGQLSSAALNRVYEVGSRLSRMRSQDNDASAEENSGAGLDAGETSDSPSEPVEPLPSS